MLVKKDGLKEAGSIPTRDSGTSNPIKGSKNWIKDYYYNIGIEKIYTAHRKDFNLQAFAFCYKKDLESIYKYKEEEWSD